MKRDMKLRISWRNDDYKNWKDTSKNTSVKLKKDEALRRSLGTKTSKNDIKLNMAVKNTLSD